MTSLLVGMVGMAPASIVLSARAFLPQRILLVYSQVTETIARIVQGQLEGDVRILCVDANRLEAISLAVAAALESLQDTTQLIVDLTGGTKAMSIGLWEGTRGLLSDGGNLRRTAVYLTREGTLLHAGSGEPVAAAEDVAIDPEEVIRWSRPAAQASIRWRGSPADLEETVRRRRQVWQQLAKALTAGRWRPNVARPQRRFIPGRMPASLPKGFLIDDHGAIEVPRDFLLQNEWLEELALLEVADAVKKLPGVRLALSAIVREIIGGSIIEFDLVATRGSRILVVEAKTVTRHVGPDLSMKAGHVSSVFGPTARLVAFVPKVFGTQPPAQQARNAIQGNLGRNGHVCCTIADLGEQTRAILGG